MKKDVSHSKWKQFLIDLAIIAACLTLFAMFPSNNFPENLTKNIFFLAIVPVLYIKIILKKDLLDFGLNLKDKKVGFISAGIGLIFLLGVFYFLIQFTGFRKAYLIPSGISKNFWIFMLYELVFLNITLFFQEFFFRGFVLSILKEKFSYWAIPIQSGLATIPLLFLGNSPWTLLPLITSSLLGGFIAWKNKAFIYSYAMSLIFFILLDAYIIHLVNFK